jgi:putative iron-regulated protein
MASLSLLSRNIFALSLALGGTAGSVAGCGTGQSDSTDSANGGQGGAGTELDPKLTREVATQYAKIVAATYEDAHASALTLQTKVEAFIERPSDETLEAARAAWLEAREPYLQTEAFRFYEGPIDDPDNGPEGRINAWPLDEAYVDYVKDDPTSGIINDPKIEISVLTLTDLNENGGEKNIATGYHAIEFLLWGQDFSADGPGNRPVSDYTEADNAERRGQYLSVVTDLLVSDLKYLSDAWASSGDNYRDEFLAASPDEQLRRMLTGLIILSGFETGGERLQTALDTRDQEDEHSCFSDNTHRDMVGDILGIQNVYLGRYESQGTELAGKGIYDLVYETDPQLADEVRDQIEKSLTLALALNPPFDQEIRSTEGRKRVQDLIVSLRQEQEPLLEKVFRKFGLNIPSPE